MLGGSRAASGQTLADFHTVACSASLPGICGRETTDLILQRRQDRASHLLDVVSSLQRCTVASHEHASRKQIQVVVLRRVGGTLEHVQHLLSDQETTWREAEKVNTPVFTVAPNQPSRRIFNNFNNNTQNWKRFRGKTDSGGQRNTWHSSLIKEIEQLLHE